MCTIAYSLAERYWKNLGIYPLAQGLIYSAGPVSRRCVISTLSRKNRQGVPQATLEDNSKLTSSRRCGYAWSPMVAKCDSSSLLRMDSTVRTTFCTMAHVASLASFGPRLVCSKRRVSSNCEETMRYTESFFDSVWRHIGDGTLRSPDFPLGGLKGNTQGRIRAPVTVRLAALR